MGKSRGPKTILEEREKEDGERITVNDNRNKKKIVE